jgi:putative endonuclease
MIKCINGSFYTGYTADLKKRYFQHCKGKAARYTRMNPPIAMVYFEKLETRKNAMTRERKIKKMTHNQKVQLLKTLTKSEKNKLLSISSSIQSKLEQQIVEKRD